MKQPLLLALLFVAALVVAPMPATATPGGLDKNGCHYDRGGNGYHCHQSMPPNPDIHAPVKKSRENVCHDDKSPNYRTLRYFISYDSMMECVASGGVEKLH